MAHPCKVCQHPEREAVEKAMVEGGTNAGIARGYSGLKDDNVRNHRPHLPAAIVRHAGAEAKDAANSVLGQMLDLQRRTLAILARAEDPEQGDARIAVVAIREVRENLNFLVKLGEALNAGTDELEVVLRVAAE